MYLVNAHYDMVWYHTVLLGKIILTELPIRSLIEDNRDSKDIV